MPQRHPVKLGVRAVSIIFRLGAILLLAYIGYSVYRILLQGIFGSRYILPAVAIWIFTAYVVLPRVHRLLTKIYIPDYYIGRTRTGDGLYGDPVNIGFFASKESLIQSMKKAGWFQADELSSKTAFKMTFFTLFKKSYPNAPVSSLFLFARKQDLAFQQEVNNNPHSRHHIRFWKVPKNWRLPGGHDAEWLAAATFDTNVGLSWFTFQLTHKIDENIDKERDHVIATLKKAGQIKSMEKVENFTTAYHSRNGGGDMVKTDGSMSFLRLSSKL